MRTLRLNFYCFWNKAGADREVDALTILSAHELFPHFSYLY